MTAAQHANKVEVLSVFLGNQSFGIPIARIQDVLRPLPVTIVPLAHNAIEGICNLRGRIVTAISLRRRLAEASAPASEGMNVVIDEEGDLYSFLVDRVGDVLTLNEIDLEPPPLTLSQSWRDISTGVYQQDGNIMIVLDPKKVIQL